MLRQAVADCIQAIRVNHVGVLGHFLTLKPACRHAGVTCVQSNLWYYEFRMRMDGEGTPRSTEQTPVQEVARSDVQFVHYNA